MPISLPPDLEQFVEAELAGGKYSSEDDLLREALRALMDRDRRRNELRAAIAPAAERLAHGEGLHLSTDDELRAFFEGVKQRGRERLNAEQRG